MNDENSILVMDLETKTFGKPNPDKDELRVFGCYSYKTGKYYCLFKKEEMQKVINAHKFIVGFNNNYYDNPIAKRFGLNFDYKIFIDLKEIFVSRAGVMAIKKGMLGDLLMKFSLDFITRTLGIVNDDTAKKELDYNILKKDVWTPEELKEIKEYTIRDLEITKKLYDWIEEYFSSFKDFLNENDIKKKQYLTLGIPKFAYKAICNAMNWPEEYDKINPEGSGIAGGYVAYPAGEKFEGNIYCLDFNSLYPSIMIQCNLYGRKKDMIVGDRPTWNGNNVFDVKGHYYSDKLSDVGKLFNNWYFMRLFFKRKFYSVDDNKCYSFKDIEKFKDKKIYTYNHDDWKGDVLKIVVDDKLIENYKKLFDSGVDRREYSVKIILNTSYGILNNMYYKLVYDTVAGGDCTRIGRQWVKLARKMFRDDGYIVIYTDTDSVYIIDVFNDKERMLKTKDKIIDYIKATVPFPIVWFDMGIDDEITHMFFFRGGNKEEKETDKEMDSDDIKNKPLGFMKKNYIYLTKEGKVKIKNLGIRKKSISALTKKIFWEHLVPKIKEKGEVKFSKVYLKNLITELLEEDISLASMRKSIGDISQYEKSTTGLQAQISRKYGSGIHFLIPNTRGIGVGKSKKYCTIEEFEENNLKPHHVDLSNVWCELEYFIKPVITKNIWEYEKK